MKEVRMKRRDGGKKVVDGVAKLVKDSPCNWGRWGSQDEVGALNYLSSKEVMLGLNSVKHGTVFSLGLVVGNPAGDPQILTRQKTLRVNLRDRASYTSGKSKPFDGGMEFADDLISISLHGSTHLDALGHPWYDEKLWNGYDANTTVDSLQKDSILPIAERSVVGQATLLDIARDKGVRALDRTYEITLDDLLTCSNHQGVEIGKREILIIRTGWLELFYSKGREAWFGQEPYEEPGLTYRKALVSWFHKMEIPLLGSDTLACEKHRHPETGIRNSLHAALIRNLGIVFNELLWLENLAEDCARDNRWKFLYIAAPLKILGGTASPVNPIAIK